MSTEDGPKTLDEAMALFDGAKVTLHRYKVRPDTWHVQAFSLSMKHVGTPVEALCKFYRVYGLLKKLG